MFGEGEYLTVIKVSRVDGTRANGNEKYTLLSVLSAKFCHRHVQTSFTDRIRRVQGSVVFGGPVIICQTSGYGKNFLGLALEDEWHEEVEEMDVPNDIGFEGIEQVLFKTLWLFTPIAIVTFPYTLMMGVSVKN